MSIVTSSLEKNHDAAHVKSFLSSSYGHLGLPPTAWPNNRLFTNSIFAYEEGIIKSTINIILPIILWLRYNCSEKACNLPRTHSPEPDIPLKPVQLTVYYNYSSQN